MPPSALFAGIRGTLVLLVLTLPACHRAVRTHARAQSPEATSPARPALPDFAVNAVATHEGEAFWYDVPAESLPRRRAWAGELTAASDSLPLGAYARVRRLDGGPGGAGIVVRITDTGIHHRGGIIDLNRDAAEALDMVRLGQARVRVETLALRNASTDKPVDKRNAPVAPKASALKGQPAADVQAEKEAADTKQAGGGGSR